MDSGRRVRRGTQLREDRGAETRDGACTQSGKVSGGAESGVEQKNRIGF